jgi:hypothetical protein
VATKQEQTVDSSQTSAFGVPTDSVGQPNFAPIVGQIQCEMRDMVRDDSNDVASFHRLFLLNGDYDLAVALIIDGLQQHKFTENLQLSFREIYSSWKDRGLIFNCPSREHSD